MFYQVEGGGGEEGRREGGKGGGGGWALEKTFDPEQRTCYTEEPCNKPNIPRQVSF